jgi:hypothetical protein
VSDWRDDLPPIPGERIRATAIREGARRVEARLRRQRIVLAGGASVAAVALVVFAAARLDLQGDDDDDSAGGTAGTEAAAATDGRAAPTAGTTSGTYATAGTEAPATTTGPATGTSGAPATTEPTSETLGAATTAPAITTPGTGFLDYTTIGGPIAALPPNATVTASPTVIWEQPASGLECGATLLRITFDPRSQVQTPVVHWETSGVRDQARMEIVAGTARAAIGPFPADTLDDGTNHEVLVYVTEREVFGDHVFRAPIVVLRDCSP